uniref:RCC1-like domain-containing protein n=1 Tax=Guillardia theta TaxID=55529 RepID=A0A7S4J9R9_GUITH|mmetsp:Transcript_1429/g.4326  ORF Transcript_1429/g.4326 Transcript_1429/m.4326 type:complete len:673 (+) Transcript_1429:163-2181(+)
MKHAKGLRRTTVSAGLVLLLSYQLSCGSTESRCPKHIVKDGFGNCKILRLQLRGGKSEDHTANAENFNTSWKTTINQNSNLPVDIMNSPLATEEEREFLENYERETNVSEVGELDDTGYKWSILKPGSGHFPYPRVPLRYLYNETLANRDPYIQALKRSNVSANENLWMPDMLPKEHDDTLDGFIDYYNDPSSEDKDSRYPDLTRLDVCPEVPQDPEIFEFPVYTRTKQHEEAAEEGDFAGMVLGCGGNDLGQLGVGEGQPGEPAHGSIPEHARGADFGYDARGFPIDHAGDEHYGSNTVPVALDRLRHVAIKFLRCGWNHAFALAEEKDGQQTLYGWGCNIYRQVGIDTDVPIDAPHQIHLERVNQNIKDIACGVCHSLVLCNDGSVFSFGGNVHGQLGLDIPLERKIFKPQRVCLPGKCVSIACGDFHSMFLLEEGDLFACGLNCCGQLGIGDSCENVSRPLPVEAFDGVGVREVGCGGEHTIVVDRNEGVWAFGSNCFGQLGCLKHPSTFHPPESCKETEPIEMVFRPDKPAVRVSKIICGVQHTILLFEDGELWGCGRNTFGALGLTHEAMAYHLTPITPWWKQFHNFSRVLEVACGFDFTIAALDNGDVVACGMNDRGQLGLGNWIRPTEPVPIPAYCQRGFHIACMMETSFAYSSSYKAHASEEFV